MADFDFSTLITDRSASDLELLRDLLSTPVSEWTEEQLAAFNQAISKGAYNYTDLNRVTAAMDDINERLTAAGYKTGYQRVVVPHKAGSGGLPVITEYRYLRMTITAIRSGGSTVQLSEIELVDSDNGTDFPWPATTAVTSSIQAVSSEPAQNIIDGSTSTKFCSTAFTSGATLTIDLGEGNRVDLGLYNTWQWYTANDAPERDPVSFSLDVSNDGTHWLSVDSVSGASITETRQALAYSGSITLPTFTRVSYIESSGSEYVDTGIKPNQNTRVICGFRLLSDNGAHQVIFGSRTSSSSNQFAFGFAGHNSKTFRSDYGSGNVSFPSSLSVTGKYEVDKSKNVCSMGGETVNNTAATFSGEYNLCIFANSTAGEIDNFSTMDLTFCQIYDDNVLVRDYVPAKISDGTVGLYDLVGDVFYENSGAGEFTAGAELRQFDATSTEELDPYLWYEQDVPTESAMSAYLANVSALRGTLTLPANTPAVPRDMDGLTAAEANNIETILSTVNDYLVVLQKVFLRSGMAWAVSGGPGFYFVN